MIALVWRRPLEESVEIRKHGCIDEVLVDDKATVSVQLRGNVVMTIKYVLL